MSFLLHRKPNDEGDVLFEDRDYVSNTTQLLGGRRG